MMETIQNLLVEISSFIIVSYINKQGIVYNILIQFAITLKFRKKNLVNNYYTVNSYAFFFM